LPVAPDASLERKLEKHDEKKRNLIQVMRSMTCARELIALQNRFPAGTASVTACCTDLLHILHMLIGCRAVIPVNHQLNLPSGPHSFNFNITAIAAIVSGSACLCCDLML
jgi:hypothetical protein